MFQTSTIVSLLNDVYEGEMTMGEVLAHGDLGLGTLCGLDGEMLVVDGEALVGRADGSLSLVPLDTRIPFAVVTPFAPGLPITLGPLVHSDLLTALDRASPAPVCAVRVEGRFSRLRLRAVRRQHPPYPPLSEVVKEQAEWEVGAADAVLVGFRFPQMAAGVQVPGWHLHAATADRTTGGHVLIADLESGEALLDAAQEVHLELPPGVDITAAGHARRRAIADAETRSG